ncbi:MAG: formate dehydrogenase subunit gamma [Acidobacteria bacterium]|nr:MAG: formate dehydrogenase subunit gamma [Acidobacteriota bacterium]
MARQRGHDRWIGRIVRALFALWAEGTRRRRLGHQAGRRKNVSHPQQIIPHGHVLRYTLRERLVHWIAGVSYVYLLGTGLAFWSPWLFWLAAALGGAQVSRTLHSWAGLIFVGAVWYMYVMWAPQMKHTDDDRRWWKALKYYSTNQDEKMPPAGRYNAGQKFLFWGFFWCSLLLLLSGVFLWAPQYFAWHSLLAMRIAVLVHASAALFTIGLFMIHLYMGIFAERGAFGSVIRGDVSIAFAKRYHPTWYKEIVGESSSPRK